MPRTITQTIKKTKPVQTSYEALRVAQYLMSLDSERKFFTNRRMRVSKTSVSAPQEGNIRLNNLLYLLQILYYLKYKKMLFAEPLLAFEQGIIVYPVYSSFTNLYYDTTKTSSINTFDAKTKKFLRDWFTYFRSYSPTELINISQGDPAWFSTWQKESNPQIDFTNSSQLKFYEEYFTNFLTPVKTS